MVRRAAAVQLHPYELWREGGVIRLVFAYDAYLGTRAMKELLRVLSAVDPTGRAPLLVEQEGGLVVDDRARDIVRRGSGVQGRPVAFLAHDPGDRMRGEMMARHFQGSFPFRTFTWQEDAVRWVDGWMRSPELRVLK